MDHHDLEKTTSASLMLPREEKEKVVIIAPNHGGKILIREDTIMANLPGCAGCGRTQFACAGVKKKWSALCWGRQSDKKYYCSLLLLSTTFVISLIGTIFFCFTNTINNAILSSMIIRNNSLAFSMWRRPTVHPMMKVHVFNYTNWDEVRYDPRKKLHVQDVGPYVYSQYLERVNINFEGDKLTFQERNNFKFLPELSVGPHFDKVFVPNLPLLVAVAKAADLPYLVRMTLSTLSFAADHKDAFIELPIQRFLWGYDDRIIDLVKPILSLKGELNFEKFGLLVTKNGTASDIFTINTGEHNKNRMNIIEKFNGDAKLSFWGSPECNSIEASDGTIFPPSMLDKKSPLYIFYPNLCRRLPFQFIKEVEIADGVQLLRYGMPKDVFDDPEHNPANECYCETDSGTCPPKGIINVTACAMGAPALASFPHFRHGDPSLTNKIDGLNPEADLEDSYLDIHPTLGIALSGKSSLQINVQVKKSSAFSSLSFLEDGLILPVAWIEMGLEELPESLRSLVYHGTYSTAAAQLGLTVFCILALTVSSICLIVMIVRRRRKPCAIVKILPADVEMKSALS